MLRLTIEQMNSLMAKAKVPKPDVPDVAKARKYKNHKVKLDGRVFDSKLEAKRYAELKLWEKAGEIEGLECQVTYRLEVNSMLICRYIADFIYYRAGSVTLTVEDVKGVRTPEYRLKYKLMRALHGIMIAEWPKKGKARARKP